MNSYLLNIVRIALGTGPRVGPRQDYIHGGLEIIEEEIVTASQPRSSATPVAASSAESGVDLEKAEGPKELIRIEKRGAVEKPMNVTELSEEHVHVTGTPQREGGKQAVVPPTKYLTQELEKVERETTLRTEKLKTAETLRELVREAAPVVLQQFTENVRTELHRHESIQSVERTAVNEIRAQQSTYPRLPKNQAQEALPEWPRIEVIEETEPKTEIHIGRIDVRAHLPAKEDRKRGHHKKQAAVTLAEYLQNRSRGEQ